MSTTVAFACSQYQLQVERSHASILLPTTSPVQGAEGSEAYAMLSQFFLLVCFTEQGQIFRQNATLNKGQVRKRITCFFNRFIYLRCKVNSHSAYAIPLYV